MKNEIKFIETENINQENGVKGFYSLRYGGFSQDGFESLNCGLYTLDNTNVVKKNINAFLKTIGNNSNNLALCKQVHGNLVRVIKSGDEISKKEFEPIGEYDAMVTNQENITLFTYHADCFAIFLYDSNKKVIGLAHAGWKGVHLNIAQNVINQMIENFGSLTEDITAYISPGIQQCCFEVSNEVRDAFLDEYNWVKPYIKQKNQEKAHIDLQGIINTQLEHMGVLDIMQSKLCTCCNEDQFFSYRRDGVMTGRMGAFISLKEEANG